MSKFKEGDKFTLGDATGVVTHVSGSEDYGVKFDGNDGLTNYMTKRWFDSVAEKVEIPLLYDNAVILCEGRYPVVSMMGKWYQAQVSWGRVHPELIETDEEDVRHALATATALYKSGKKLNIEEYR